MMTLHPFEQSSLTVFNDAPKCDVEDFEWNLSGIIGMMLEKCWLYFLLDGSKEDITDLKATFII